MKQRSLKVNAVLNIIYKLSSIVFPLIVYPYVSRVLLADNMGKVSFFTALTNYAMMIGSLGVSTYGVRATAKVRDDKRELSITVKELMRLNLNVTSIVLLVLIGTVPFVVRFQQNWPLLLISCIQIAVAPFSMEWLYNGLEQYDYITRRAITIKLISLVLIFTFVHKRSDYVIYAGIMAFGYVGNYIWNYAHSRRFIDYSVKTEWNIKRHLKPTILLFASILAINIYTNVDTIMLGFINGDRAVGLYDVAVKAKLVLLQLINAISMVLFPRLSYYLANDDVNSYNKILKKSISIIMCLAVPMCLFFIIGAKDVVLVLGGSDYVDATLGMQILMPILVISGFSNITGNQMLLPHGKDSSYMKAVTCGAVVDIILNLVFMPKFSLYGAAAATLVAEIVQMSIQTYEAKEYIKGNFNFAEVIRIAIAAFLSTIVLVLIRNHISFTPLINLIICFIAFACIYALLLIVFRVGVFTELLAESSHKLHK